MIRIYIGYDSREKDAYDVCVNSLKEYECEIVPLKINELIEKNIYNRENDPLASTEFTYSRFLVPYLNNFNGICLFCDCDFIFLKDPNEIVKYNLNLNYAVNVVKHLEYVPKSTKKMDGKIQSTYPRKNWSSLMLWNCSHNSNFKLQPELINRESGKFFHRFEWLADNDIGEIPLNWNWLVGYYEETEYLKPYALHFTDGGPWFDEYKNCEYSDIYFKYLNYDK